MNTSLSARDTLKQSAGPTAIVVANTLLVGAAVMLMRAYGNSAEPILLAIAAVCASIGLVWTVLRVHQRDRRRAALFLFAGVFCLLSGMMIGPPFPAEVMAVSAIVLMMTATFLGMRAFRTSDAAGLRKQ